MCRYIYRQGYHHTHSPHAQSCCYALYPYYIYVHISNSDKLKKNPGKVYPLEHLNRILKRNPKMFPI